MAASHSTAHRAPLNPRTGAHLPQFFIDYPEIFEQACVQGWDHLSDAEISELEDFMDELDALDCDTELALALLPARKALMCKPVADEAPAPELNTSRRMTPEDRAQLQREIDLILEGVCC